MWRARRVHRVEYTGVYLVYAWGRQYTVGRLGCCTRCTGEPRREHRVQPTVYLRPHVLRPHGVRATPGECTVYHPQPGKEGVLRLVETGSSACASGAVIGGDNTVDWRDELGDGEGLSALSSTATLDSESFYPQKQVSPTRDP